MISEVEDIFTYLLVICESSLEKCLFKYFVLFQAGLFVGYFFWFFICTIELFEFYIYLDSNPLPNI